MSGSTFAQDHTTVVAGPYQNTPLGYAQFNVSSVTTLAAGLAVATKPYTLTGIERSALFSVEIAAVRWTDDNQTPSATYGQPLGSGQAEQISTNFGQMQIVSQGGTATVNVSFYK